MRKLDVEGWTKPKQKHNIEVKIKCVMRNEWIDDLATNHNPTPLPEQKQMWALDVEEMESSFKIDLEMCHGGSPSKMLVDLGRW